MGQSSYSSTLTAKRAGKPVDLQAKLHGDVITGRNELSTAIKPGLFVAQGASADDVMINDTTATGAAYLGLAIDQDTRERTSGATTTTGYAQNDLVPVARSGRWYVTCESAATKGNTVYVRYKTGTASTIGAAYSSADTATCDAIKAKFAETIVAAGVVAVELNIAQV